MRHSDQPAVLVLERPVTPWDHWGDYAAVLIHGLTSHRSRENGLLQLERTGPFMPGVSFPGISDIVVTDRAKEQLAAVLPLLTFRPVVLRRAVRLDWHLWDRSLKTPPFLPKSGEPEDYVLRPKGDPTLVSEMGALWELVPDLVAEIQGSGGTFRPARYSGQHLVRATEMAGYNFVSEKLHHALSVVAPGEVQFNTAVQANDA